MSAQPNIARDGESAARADISHSLRAISFGDPAVSIDRKVDGTAYLRPVRALPDYPIRITDRLHDWASTTPDRVFMAERVTDGHVVASPGPLAP